MHQGAVTESSTGFTFKSITLPDMQNSLFLNNTDGKKKTMRIQINHVM